MSIRGISMVISCHNDGKLLPNLFESIILQKEIKGNCEFILIDNASIDNTRSVYEQYEKRIKSKNFSFNYYFEKQRGLNHARNRGIKEAMFEYVGFTDADAKFNSDFLEILWMLIIKHQPLILGGPYFPWYNSAKPKWYKDSYNSGILSYKEEFLSVGKYPSGINMIFKKKELLDIGCFTTKINYTGKFDRGEETELFYRYYKRYNKPIIYYNPKMIVYHYTRPGNMHLSFWVKSYIGTAKNHTVFMQAPSLVKIFRDLLWVLKSILIAFSRYVLIKNTKYNHFYHFIIEEILPYTYSLAKAFYFLLRKFHLKN